MKCVWCKTIVFSLYIIGSILFDLIFNHIYFDNVGLCYKARKQFTINYGGMPHQKFVLFTISYFYLKHVITVRNMIFALFDFIRIFRCFYKDRE